MMVHILRSFDIRLISKETAGQARDISTEEIEAAFLVVISVYLGNKQGTSYRQKEAVLFRL